jgi:hypothetical protein
MLAGSATGAPGGRCHLVQLRAQELDSGCQMLLVRPLPCFVALPLPSLPARAGEAVPLRKRRIGSVGHANVLQQGVSLPGVAGSADGAEVRDFIGTISRDLALTVAVRTQEWHGSVHAARLPIGLMGELVGVDGSQEPQDRLRDYTREAVAASETVSSKYLDMQGIRDGIALRSWGRLEPNGAHLLSPICLSA